MHRILSLVVALALFAGLATAQTSLLDEIKLRGTLACGVDVRGVDGVELPRPLLAVASPAGACDVVVGGRLAAR